MTTIDKLEEQINALKKEVKDLTARVKELEDDKIRQMPKQQTEQDIPASAFKFGKTKI